jgi:hypothetical protein
MRFTLDNNWSRGFTLVEVMVIAPIVILVIGGFVALIIALTGDVLRVSENNKLIYGAQSSLDIIEQDVKQASSFQSTSFIPTSPQGLNNTAAAFTGVTTGVNGNQNTSFILRVPATNKNPLDPTHQIVYRANSPYTCADPAVVKNAPYLVDLVYYYTYDTYPSSLTLWRRTLVDSSASDTPCSTPWQQSSCYPGQVGAVCKVEDTKVLTNISAITRQYYATAASVAVIDTGDQSNPYASNGTNAASLYISLQTSKMVAGKPVTGSFDLRPSRQVENVASTVTSTAAQSKTPCILQNGWANYGSPYATANYGRTSAGVVALSGLVANGNGVSGEVICVLPPGYRPPYRLIFNPYSCGTVASRIDIAQNGEVRYLGGNVGCVSLNGINFLPVGATWTSLVGANGWTNYGADHAPVQASQDASGRVFIQGLAAGGTMTAGTLMFTLPAAIAAYSYYDIYPAHSNGINASWQLQPNKTFVTRGSGGNGYFSLQAMYYPSTAGTWTNATLLNGWGNYGTYSPASYIKNADGMVSLRGLISGGTATAYTTTIFTLPAGYRPSERIICGVVTTPDVESRIDVDLNGNVILGDGVNNGWLSLAGCDFVADQ